MDESALRACLLGKPEAREDYPFGPEAAVFKVQGRMFALISHRQGQVHLNLKCEPNEAMQLRDVFDAVRPGYHMNKRHWNTVVMDGSLPRGEIERMIDQSYGLVVKKLKKSVRLGLEARHGRAALYGYRQP